LTKTKFDDKNINTNNLSVTLKVRLIFLTTSLNIYNIFKIMSYKDAS